MMQWDCGFFQPDRGIYTYITSGITMMSNAGIIAGTDAALMFDTFITVGMTKDFISSYREASSVPIRYLVLSHAHGDRVHGGIARGSAASEYHGL